MSRSEAGQIDAYPEYTGTLTMEILSADRPQNDADIERALARRGIKMSRRLGFNNSYAIGLKQSLADELGIKTFRTWLAGRANERIARLKFGFSDEFMNRGDGWPGFARAYRLPDRARGLDHNLAYRGIRSGTIHLTDVYTTDPEIAAYEMTTLEDDLGYFPQYESVILYRADMLERAPRSSPTGCGWREPSTNRR